MDASLNIILSVCPYPNFRKILRNFKRGFLRSVETFREENQDYVLHEDNNTKHWSHLCITWKLAGRHVLTVKQLSLHLGKKIKTRSCKKITTQNIGAISESHGRQKKGSNNGLACKFHGCQSNWKCVWRPMKTKFAEKPQSSSFLHTSGRYGGHFTGTCRKIDQVYQESILDRSILKNDGDQMNY